MGIKYLCVCFPPFFICHNRAPSPTKSTLLIHPQPEGIHASKGIPSVLELLLGVTQSCPLFKFSSYVDVRPIIQVSFIAVTSFDFLDTKLTECSIIGTIGPISLVKLIVGLLHEYNYDDTSEINILRLMN